MSNEPSDRKSEPEEKKVSAEDMVNPAEDLIYAGGYTTDPRETINNPAVAPQMLNNSGDLRGDLIEDE
ncbi:hypothetical protein [Microcoleus sp. FACHB-68]|uniref:hypothetical protein n=1 Tax=Microcoleus sp. FACHB-68 TaxID=2692826 RepID=UPI0016850EB4|nr:hypothetical protein [Microcoleus sp. FACHB-68]MBD1936859.1 hypothetical protein [Microcoleus sp. FACHB-68]